MKLSINISIELPDGSPEPTISINTDHIKPPTEVALTDMLSIQDTSRKCMSCGISFEPKAKHQLYHSTKCKDTYYRKRKKMRLNSSTKNNKIQIPNNDYDKVVDASGMTPVTPDPTYIDRKYDPSSIDDKGYASLLDGAAERHKNIIKRYGVPKIDS